MREVLLGNATKAVKFSATLIERGVSVSGLTAAPPARFIGVGQGRPEAGARQMDDDDRREELRETFDAFDRDGSGTIGVEEFGKLLKLLGAGMSASDLKIGFRELDRDGSGAIGFEEFYAWWTDQ